MSFGKTKYDGKWNYSILLIVLGLFFLFNFNRMELLERCIVLMSIKEGVGVSVRAGRGEKYDDKVGRGG